MYDTQTLIVIKWIKNKKLLTFIKEFCYNLKFYSVGSFTNSLQKIILNYPKLCFDIGFSHLIIFSSYKNKNFLKISKTPRGPAVIFLIIKYAIRNEICITSYFKNQFNSPILLLNNFNHEKKNLQIISTIIRQLFPDRKTNDKSIDKPSEIILFDFNSLYNKIEVRNYIVNGVSRLIPRYLRKDKKQIDSSSNLGFENGLSYIKKKNNKKNSKNISFIRVIEVGPRLTLETIDFVGLQQTT